MKEIKSKKGDFQNHFKEDFRLIKSLWVEIFLPVRDLPTALALDYRPTLQFFRQFQDFDMDSLARKHTPFLSAEAVGAGS